MRSDAAFFRHFQVLLRGDVCFVRAIVVRRDVWFVLGFVLHKWVLWAAPVRTRAGGTRRVRNREASACEWPSGGIIDKRFSGGRVRFVVRLVSDGAHISLGSSAF